MEIWFYHLESQPLERVLPALIEKAIARNWRVVVQTVDDLRVKALDDLLWKYRPEAFLPHGTSRDPAAADQPILVTREADNPNQADVRILVEGAEIAVGPSDEYARVILAFDGRNEVALDGARAQWSRLKTEGRQLAYWRQSAEGRWDRQM